MHTRIFAAFRSAQPSGLLKESLEFFKTPFAYGPEVLTALAEPDASHSWITAAAAERCDLTLMQPLHSGLHSCSVLLDSSSAGLSRARNVFPELRKLGISQPSGLLAAILSAHEEPKKAAGLNTAQFFTQQGMDFTGRSIWPVP